ncbi:RrF2 family transcriptional regulator [Sphingopyxis terrae]|uniref:RrF2 family transcriptional regulator n=1 Tax=Sphingopyxis terrae TaxID=33052 RepID=UPI000788392B|nr:Rrf2 family transcriptional regulator [Sphingopyxis terrae]
MRLAQGIEWAIHACTLLAPLGREHGLSLTALAAFHGVAAPYMAKQMQLLSAAGIVRSSRGATGGYTLAKPPAEISLYDVVRAIEGPAPAFRCTEIRQRGPCARPRSECRLPCGIAAAFAAAEAAWRGHLAAISIEDIVAQLRTGASDMDLGAALGWLQSNATALPIRSGGGSMQDF